jgi:preprotein translocase subunit YajC
MHLFLSLLAQASTPTTVAKSTKSSGSYVPILILVVLFGAVYLLFLRPRQQRMRQQQQATRQLSVGDEVMSAGGIYGRIVALDADAVEVEVSPGVVMTFTRRAISARPQPTGAAAPAAEPVDEPWQVEPDGPGDRAGDERGGAGGTPGAAGGAAGGSAGGSAGGAAGGTAGGTAGGAAGSGGSGDDVPPAPGAKA